jgi:hypothetical protein
MRPFLKKTGKAGGFSPAITPAGFAFIIITLIMLVRSLSSRNAYEIALSASAFIFWLFFLFFGLYAARKRKDMEPLWKPPFPVTANANEETLIAGLGPVPPWFFRIHFTVRGRFYPQGINSGCPVRAETSASRNAVTAPFKLMFPLGGVFRGEGSCRLRDIFGLFSFECGVSCHQVFNIRSGPASPKSFRLSALSGAEDRKTKSASDEERYYLREYSPGDRFRDINWKSSERIDTLITRISPDNQEKVSRIEVYFRNYGPAPDAGVSLGELWLLDRAKARLAWFLRSVKDAEASPQSGAYIFVIHTSRGAREIKDEAELETFLEELAALPFSPALNEDPLDAAGSQGEVYVFSTACDAALGAFILARGPRPVTLFLARFSETSFPEARFSEAGKRGGGKSGGEVSGSKIETLLLRDFPSQGMIPLPRWLRRGKEKRVQAGGCRLEIDYGEVRL